LTNRNKDPFWQTGPRTTKAQEKFNSEFRRNGNAARPTDLKSRVEEILARPGARSTTGMLNPRVVSREEARLIAQYESQQPEKLTPFQRMGDRLPEALGALGRAFPATAAELLPTEARGPLARLTGVEGKSPWGLSGIGETGEQFRELREQYGPTEAFRRWGEEGRPRVPSIDIPTGLREFIARGVGGATGIPQEMVEGFMPEQVGLKGGLEVFAQPDVLIGAPAIKPAVRGTGQALRTGARVVPEVAKEAVYKGLRALPTETAYAFGAAGSRVGRAVSATGADPNIVYEFQYKLVELDDLITSNTDAGAPNPRYAQELQPRLRGDRVASRLQIETIAKQLNAEELLHDAGTLDRGPMIIGSDMMVESGNGRILALRLARDQFKKKYGEYTGLLNEKLSDFGLAPNAAEGMRSPVLVRERVTDVDRVRFTAEANESATLVMSPLEQALQDAKRLTDNSLASLVVTESQTIDQALRSAGNRSIAGDFVGGLSPNERASLMTAGGELNLQGLLRLKTAIFAKVFPGEAGQRLTQIFFESLDPIVKNMENAIFDALPKLARSEGLVRSGERASTLGIGDDLARTVDVLARMKQDAMSVEDFVRQVGMFGQELNPFEERLLVHLSNIGRSRKLIREFLQEYSDAVANSPHPAQQTMMPGATPGKEQIVDNLIAKQAKEETAGPLFRTLEQRQMATGATTPEAPYTQLEGPAVRLEEAATTPTTAAVTPQTISYTPSLDIRNIDALPRGTGARYLVTIRGQGEELVASRWARVIPKRLKANEVLVDMKGEDIVKEAVTAAPTATPTAAVNEMIQDGTKLAQWMQRTGRERGLLSGKAWNIEQLNMVRRGVREEKSGEGFGLTEHKSVFDAAIGKPGDELYTDWASKAGLRNTDPQYVSDSLWLAEAKRIGLNPDELIQKYPDSFPTMQAPTRIADAPTTGARETAEQVTPIPDRPVMTEAERAAERIRATPGYRGRTKIEIGGETPVVIEDPTVGTGGPGSGAGAGGGRRGGGRPEDGGPTTVEGDPLPIPPEIDAMPEGITRDLALAEEKIRQAEPGLISKAMDKFPGLRHLYRFFVPARNLTKAQHVAWVAKSMSESRYVTEAFGRRNEVFQELDRAFGSGFKTGEKARLSYIGPSDRSRSLLVGRAIDVLPNPDHYVLSQSQLDAIASVRAYGDDLLDMAANQYGVKIGRFPIKENAAFVPNVDVSDDALELMGDAWSAARVGRAKTRVWEDAISRQAYTPDFQPETNLVRLFEASDAAKGNMVAKEVLKEAVGGKTRVEVIDALHPKLRKYKESIATKIRNLHARIETAERESSLAAGQVKQVRTQVSQAQKRARPMLERIDELGDEFGPELSYLSGQTREILIRAAALERRGVVLTLRKEAAVARGIDLAVELDKLTPLLDVLRKRYKSVGIGNNVLVQEGIFRYFPKKDADSLKQLLEVSTNPVLSAAWEIRNIAFNLDLSPITGVHLPLAFLADPVGTVGQLVRGTRTAAQKGQFLKDLTPAGLAEKIEGDPTWAEFAAVSGRPVGQTATEFAGGVLRRIPGYSKANEAMFTAVTYRTKAMYDVLVQDYVKAGIPRNEAIIAASENVHRVIPLMDHALLGQSQARAKLLQSITISPSFIFRPAELMAESATALVKVGLKQTLTTKQKMALRTALTMAATIETISVTSAMMDAWRNDKDVWKAGISATDDMAIRLMDGRKIPLGGPYRSLINALKPEWVNREMDYKMPFTRVPRWAAGKLTPAFRRQIDLLRNKDFRGRRIITGDFPSNIMQIVAYEFEGTVPLTIGAWVEGLRTGATLAKTAEEAITQFGGTSLYDRPGPWAMRSDWRDELRQYWGIPTDPNKIGTKEYPINRTTYRQRNPEIDAKLFMLGDVTSLMRIKGNPVPSASRAVPLVLRLIRENNIDPDDIRGIRERKDERAAAEEAGRRLTPNPVDRLIGLLEEARPVDTAPAPQDRTPALPAPTPALPTPTPAMPAQPGPLSTPTIEEFSRRLREYLAAREAQKTPEPVAP